MYNNNFKVFCFIVKTEKEIENRMKQQRRANVANRRKVIIVFDGIKYRQNYLLLARWSVGRCNVDERTATTQKPKKMKVNCGICRHVLQLTGDYNSRTHIHKPKVGLAQSMRAHFNFLHNIHFFSVGLCCSICRIWHSS